MADIRKTLAPEGFADQRKTLAEERKTMTGERKTMAPERKTMAEERKTMAPESPDARKTLAAERKTLAGERKTMIPDNIVDVQYADEDMNEVNTQEERPKTVCDCPCEGDEAKSHLCTCGNFKQEADCQTIAIVPEIDVNKYLQWDYDNPCQCPEDFVAKRFKAMSYVDMVRYAQADGGPEPEMQECVPQCVEECVGDEDPEMEIECVEEDYDEVVEPSEARKTFAGERKTLAGERKTLAQERKTLAAG